VRVKLHLGIGAFILMRIARFTTSIYRNFASEKIFFGCADFHLYVFAYRQNVFLSNFLYMRKNFQRSLLGDITLASFFFKNVSKINSLNFQNFSMRVSIIDSRFFTKNFYKSSKDFTPILKWILTCKDSNIHPRIYSQIRYLSIALVIQINRSTIAQISQIKFSLRHKVIPSTFSVANPAKSLYAHQPSEHPQYGQLPDRSPIRYR